MKKESRETFEGKWVDRETNLTKSCQDADLRLRGFNGPVNLE